MITDRFTKVMSLGVFIFAPIFLYVLLMTNPEQGAFQVVAFLSSLFFTVWCLSALLFYLLKRRVTNNEISYGIIKSSSRQGLLLAFMTIGLFSLGMIGLLTWWDGVLLGLSIGLLELYFTSERVSAV